MPKVAHMECSHPLYLCDRLKICKNANVHLTEEAT